MKNNLQNFYCLRVVILVVSGFFYVGCTTEFREPLCDMDTFQPPRSTIGRYVIHAPQFYVGSSAFPEVTKYQLEIAQDGLFIHLPEFAEIPGFDKARLQYSLCEIGGNHYLQSYANGAVTVMRLDISEKSVFLSHLAFEQKDLIRENVPFFLLPNVDNVISSSSFPGQGNRVILNNRNFDPALMLQLAKPIVSGLILTRDSTKLSGSYKRVNINQMDFRFLAKAISRNNRRKRGSR